MFEPKLGLSYSLITLRLHQNIKSNFNSEDTFEELQFLNNLENYEQGIDWYMNFFPERRKNSDKNLLYFEKSATYFDSDLAPKRASALMKNAKLIIILLSPSDRAYSWYQHMKAKKDPTAMKYTFYQVISNPANLTSKPLKKLQSRCLEPGKYALHIENWLKHYNSKQFHIIDGEKLKSDPIFVMDKLQHFLNVQPIVNYEKLLKFNPKKGFWCAKKSSNGIAKCLGKGKGRKYEDMEEKSRNFLENYYESDNKKLSKLLKRLKITFPDWLKNIL